MYSSTYDEIVILGEFNVWKKGNYIKIFSENYNLKGLIKQTTCYKNPDNVLCIDLVLTNVPGSFQRTCDLETGLSDFYFIPLTVMRKRFKKFYPRVIHQSFTNMFQTNILGNLC